MDYSPLDTGVNGFPSESDLVQLMCRHIPYIEQYWYEDDADHGHFGSLDVQGFQPPGGPINEMIVRSMGQEMQGYSALYKSAYFDADVNGEKWTRRKGYFIIACNERVQEREDLPYCSSALNP
jgi:hypothetical protein